MYIMLTKHKCLYGAVDERNVNIVDKVSNTYFAKNGLSFLYRK